MSGETVPTETPALVVVRPFWVSWWATKASGPFELWSPWWISGSREGGESSVVAAVVAASARGAEEMVHLAHDVVPAQLEMRFVEEKPVDWSPFSDRFPRADWMRWDMPYITSGVTS